MRPQETKSYSAGIHELSFGVFVVEVVVAQHQLGVDGSDALVNIKQADHR